MNAVLEAKNLEAEGPRGRIFGPLDLTLDARQICVVHGEQGSGKSSLLLALAARLRAATGSLTIDGIDAIANPRRAMALTGVARLGDYVAPEDRLTLRESMFERCFLEGISIHDGVARADQLERLVGFRLDRTTEMADFTPLERTIASVGLVMLRPSKVVVLDDADVLVPHEQQTLMFELISRMLSLDDAVLIAATLDRGTAPAGAVEVTLPSQKKKSSRSIDEGLAIVGLSKSEPFEIDPDVVVASIRNAGPIEDSVPDKDDAPTHDNDGHDEEVEA